MKLLDKARSILILVFIITYLASVFFPWKGLEITLFILLFILIAISIFYLKDSNKYISFSLLIIGVITLVYFDASFDQWVESIIKNAGLVALLATVPMLGFPLFYEEFQAAISDNISKFLNTPFNYYVVIAMLTFSLSVLLNLACIPIIYHLLKNVKDQYATSLFSKAVTRGFIISIIMAPNSVSVAVVLSYLEIPWIKIVPAALIFLIISIIMIICFERIFNKDLYINKDNIVENENVGRNNNSYLVKKMIFMGVFLIASIILIEMFTGLSVLVCVPLVAIFVPFFISLIWKKKHVFYSSFDNYYRVTLPNMKNEVVLFTLAGFFGQALVISGAEKYLSNLIYMLDIQQPIILIGIFMFVVILLAIVGIHPVISVSSILATLPVSTLPLMPIQFALTLLSAYAIAVLLSPVSGTVLVTAGVTQENPLNISLVLNWKYAFLSTIIYIAILSIIPY